MLLTFDDHQNGIYEQVQFSFSNSQFIYIAEMHKEMKLFAQFCEKVKDLEQDEWTLRRFIKGNTNSALLLVGNYFL